MILAGWHSTGDAPVKLIECTCGHFVEWTPARAEWKAMGKRLVCEKKECE